MSVFFDGESFFEGRNDCDNDKYEIDRVVIEKLTSDFSSESAEIEFVPAYTCPMETETDEVVLKVPIENGDAAHGRNQ